jgi:hypothetical protein
LAIAGDFAAWAAWDDNVISWLLLDSEKTEPRHLNLDFLGNDSERVQIQYLKGNADGFLLFRVQVGPSISVQSNPKAPRTYR